MDQDKKKIAGIAILIVMLFGGIALVSILLSKKEATTGFEHTPLAASTDLAQAGILLQGEGYLRWIDPMQPSKPEINKIDAEVSSDQLKWGVNRQSTDYYKVSPDGKFLAVLEPFGNKDPNSVENKIVIYNLTSGDSSTLIKANLNDLITSVSWDFSSQSVSFVTTKKIKTNNEFPFALFTGGSKKNKSYINSAGLFDSKTTTKELAATGSYYGDYNPKVIASNGNTYYVFDKGSLITVSSEVTKDKASFDEYYDIKIYNSNDYKRAIISSSSKTIIYDLEKKEKKTVLTSASNNIYSGRIISAALSPDKSGIAFIKNTSGKSTDYYGTTLDDSVDTLWYYDFETRKYTQIFSKGTSLDYRYPNYTSIAISPDGKKIALLFNVNQNEKPIPNYSFEIYPIAENSSPIITTTGNEESTILRWQ